MLNNNDLKEHKKLTIHIVLTRDKQLVRKLSNKSLI